MSSATSSRAEFRVRFTRTRGFASLFERVSNSYGWSGHGLLRIEPLGIHIAARRRRLGVTRRDQRFVAGPEIRDVYRQANSVRIEFRDEARPAFLEFWADDAATAGQIVGWLPTSRTVESDTHVMPANERVEMGIPWRAIVIPFVAVTCLLAGLWAMKTLSESRLAPETTGARSIGDLNGPVSVPEPPLTAGEIQALEADLRRFDTTGDFLRAEFMTNFTALQMGTLDRSAFINLLEQWLAPRWRSEAQRLENETPTPLSQRARLRDGLRDVAGLWQRALTRYADGLRAADVATVQASFDLMRQAESVERDARSLLDQPVN